MAEAETQDSEPKYGLGDMLLLSNDREGEVKYIGKVEGLDANTTYYGIELTDGQSAGDNSGTHNDKKYFECESNRGIFLSLDSNEIRRLLREKDFDNPRRRRNLSMKSLADLTKNNDDVSAEAALNATINSNSPSPDEKDYNDSNLNENNKNDNNNNNNNNNKKPPSSPLAGAVAQATTESGRQFQDDFNKQMNGMTEEEIISICPFILVGRGVAGIDEMREILDDSKIYFGLLQIQIGSGHFARYKNIFIHFNGEKHRKPLQRAKINRFMPKAKEIIGHCHAPLVVTSKDIFQVDWVFNSVKGIFVADDIDTGKGGPSRRVDLNTIKQDYKSLMEKAALEAEKARIRLEEEKRKMEEELKLRQQREEEERLARIAAEEAEKKRQLEEAERKKKEAELAEKRRIQEEKEKKRKEEEAARKAEEAKNNPNGSGNDASAGGSGGGKKGSGKNGKNGDSSATGGGAASGSGGSSKDGGKGGKKKKKRRKKKKQDDWSNDRPWTAERVLAAVHAEMSPYNWAIYAPNNGKKPLECLHWGHGSIASVREYLSQDKVQYGIMRLAFGSGRFRRSHFVFFLWTPDAMTQNADSGNARSKSNKSRMLHVSWQPHMQKLLAPFNVTVVAESLEKVTVQEFITRVKNNVVVDGSDALNEEALNKALAEEEEWLKKLKEKQEEEAKLRRELEEQQKQEYAKKQREKLLAEKEKAQENASEITNVRLKTPKNGSNKPNKKMSFGSNLDTPDDDDAKVLSDSEYEDYTTANDDDSNEDNDNYNNNNNNNSNDDDDNNEDEAVNLDEPIVVQLSQEELDRLAEERRLAEIEEKRKQAERAKILEEAMHSRLCLESVELVKRESEQMCWVLIEPRI